VQEGHAAPGPGEYDLAEGARYRPRRPLAIAIRRSTQHLSAGHHLAFPGILDTIALLPAPAFGGFFVLPTLAELPHEAGFLHLPLEQAQGKIYVVVLHLDYEHDVTSGAPARDALPAAWRDSP